VVAETANRIATAVFIAVVVFPLSGAGSRTSVACSLRCEITPWNVSDLNRSDLEIIMETNEQAGG
jgi:hypothetical protein